MSEGKKGIPDEFYTIDYSDLTIVNQMVFPVGAITQYEDMAGRRFVKLNRTLIESEFVVVVED